MTRPFSIAWRESPFGKIHYKAVESADRMPTIFELISPLQDLPLGFMEAGEVRLNGDVVSRQYWKQIRPKAGGLGETCLTLHMPIGNPGGGSGSAKKNTVALVATIAVLLAAAAVSGGAAAGLGAGVAGGLFTAGSASAAIASAGIGLTGALDVSALRTPA